MIQNYQDILMGLTHVQLILLVLFGMLFFWRLLHLVLFKGRLVLLRKKSNNNAEGVPLSLIMTIRNEEENLRNNIPKIFSIERNEFEMVVVDDFSQDNSYLILGLLKERYKRITISALNQETRHSTKLAQNIAIKGAQNSWVLTVPVSLREVPPDWLNLFSGATGSEKDVVIGYSNVAASKGFYNFLFRTENYFLFTKSLGYILNGLPFIYSDVNVAFKKERYFEIGGYGRKIKEAHANLELLINLFIKKSATSVLFDSKSAIRKEEKITRSDYFDLLKKSIRIEKHLPVLKRAVLLFDEFGRLVFLPFTVFITLSIPGFWLLFASLAGFYALAYLAFVVVSQSRLNERKILLPSLVYDLIMPYFKLIYRWHFTRRSKKKQMRGKV